MKASEVLRRYAAGERNFRQTNLRGQFFEGENLSGVDFSRADIRGSNFNNAILKEADFTEAQAGVQKRWLIGQLITVSWLSIVFNFTSIAVNRSFIDYFAASKEIQQQVVVINGVMLLINGILVFTIVRQGFASTTARAVSLLGVLVSTGLFTVVGENTGKGLLGLIGFIIVFSGVAISRWLIAAIAATTTVVIAIASIVSIGVLGGASLVDGYIEYHLLKKVIREDLLSNSGDELSIIAMILTGLVLYVTVCISMKDKKFIWISDLLKAFAGSGGTTFCGADLTDANFSSAILKNTNFNSAEYDETILMRVRWQNVQGLDSSQLGNSNLANSAIRNLLVTHNGCQKTYVNANLQSANLNGVNLNEANLQGAILSDATLHHAELRNANLTEVQALRTNFSDAYLTGACLEAWNIDHTTNLQNVDCQYVYLLQNQQERRPSSGDFAPGEFTKLFQEALSTVDLIFQNGVDWRAFVTAFQQVQVKNEDTLLEIQSIENKGDGVVVVRVSVPSDTSKEKIHSEFNQQYDPALKALEARYQAELQAKDGEITRYREDSANMWEVIKLQAKKPIYVQAIAQAKTMNDSTDQSQIFNVGGDFNIDATNAVVNLRDISGTVTNAIKQLPESSDPDQPDLKQLLMQLKEAIAVDADLPDIDKADLLEQVQLLAEAKQTEEPAKKEGLARKAKKMFGATLKSLPDTAKIVESCNKPLPLILKALGLSM